jgi:hypothetical protein
MEWQEAQRSKDNDPDGHVWTVRDRAVPPKLAPGESAVIDPASNTARRQKESWYFEDRQPGVVYAGFQERRVYMRVAVRYDAHNVTMEIVDSRGLKQSEDRIHKRVRLVAAT